MKNNIEYYSHFCNSDQHPKFKMLRVKYGWAGDGRFWALNNRIGLSENCELDLDQEYNKAVLCDDLKFTLPELENFLEYLEKRCKLITKKNGCITTEIIQDNLERVMKLREKNQKNYKKSLKKSKMKTESEPIEKKIQPVEKKIKPSENIQSKVKETKEKERKEKELKKLEADILKVIKQFNEVLKKKKEFYEKKYPDRNHILEYRLMIDWIRRNYNKAKDRKDWNLFIHKWLNGSKVTYKGNRKKWEEVGPKITIEQEAEIKPDTLNILKHKISQVEKFITKTNGELEVGKHKGQSKKLFTEAVSKQEKELKKLKKELKELENKK